MKTKERGREERSVRTRRTRLKEKKKRKKSQKGSDFAERKREREREQQESEKEPMVPGNAESARPRGWSDGEEFRDMCRMRYKEVGMREEAAVYGVFQRKVYILLGTVYRALCTLYSALSTMCWSTPRLKSMHARPQGAKNWRSHFLPLRMRGKILLGGCLFIVTRSGESVCGSAVPCLSYSFCLV